MASRPLKILIAEDKPSVADSLAFMLRHDGHKVEIVSDGLQAFMTLNSRPNGFDLLITDNNMPKLDGYELVQRLRGKDNQIKVILLSAYLTCELIRKYDALGVTHTVDKPFDFSPLRVAIAEITEMIDAPVH